MTKKLLLAAIGIIAIIAVACRGKDENSKVISTDETQEESNTKGVTKGAKAVGDNETQSDEKEASVIQDETESQDNTDASDTKEERKNSYRDVDIKVPSIHED
jgi:hypothetical protein